MLNREPPSQRRHYRVTAPAVVVFDDVPYAARDWGLGGFCIERFERNATLGNRLPIQFALAFQGFEISFSAVAEIVRIENHSLAAKFAGLGERELGLLQYFATGVGSGQLSVVNGVLAHMDRPVTIVPGVPRLDSPRAERNHRLRRLAIATAYLCAGLLVGSYLLFLLLEKLFRLDIETAVVSMPLEQIVSKDTGQLAEVYVRPGTVLKAGQPLFRLDSDDVRREVMLAYRDTEASRIALEDIQARKRQELEKLQTYRHISTDQLDVAAARVAAFTAELEAAKTELIRVKTMVDAGLKEKLLYDVQDALVAKTQAKLEEARAEFKVMQTSLKSTESGFFFGGHFLVGDLHGLLGDEAAARDRLATAQTGFQDAKSREGNLTYRAPFDGIVTRVFKSPGTTVDRGEGILIIERTNGVPYVDAYLTQKEVESLHVGVRGLAYLPAANKSFTVEVTSVDRTAGFLKDVQTPKLVPPQYNWRGVEDRSAYAKFTFVVLKPEEQQVLVPGLPVLVNFPTTRYLSVLSLFYPVGQSGQQNRNQHPPAPALEPQPPKPAVPDPSTAGLEPSKSNSGSPTSKTVPAAVISQVRLSQTNNQTQVGVEGSRRLTYDAKLLGSPDRLIVDFSGARLSVPHKQVSSIWEPLKAVRLSQFRSDVVRMVIDLTQKAPYSVSADDSAMTVSFGPLVARDRGVAQARGLLEQSIASAEPAPSPPRPDMSCSPHLWPSDSLLFRPSASQRADDPEFQSVRKAILDAANLVLQASPAPVETLHSAGVTDQNDPAFQHTRRAFHDPDSFAVLALAYSLTGEDSYLNAARRFLLEWSSTNKPTGNPIDETPLEGFLWGIDLIRCKLDPAQTQAVMQWVGRWEAAKRSWHFGPKTTFNNHKTHHLKILLIMDKLLDRPVEFRKDLTDAERHLQVNLPSGDGSSLDYHERDALHYHAYDLEAWIEIALVTGCCMDSIDRAFAFLQRSLEQHPEHTEFAASTAPIDKKRAEVGFGYAQAKPYDPRKAARVVLSYATLPGKHVSPDFWRVAVEGEQRNKLFYWARFYLWRAS